MTPRTVVYDSGMLIALLRKAPAATLLHHALRAAVHRPVVVGPVIARCWRPDPATMHTFSQVLKDCTVPLARGAPAPMRRSGNGTTCIACARTISLGSYKRAGIMLGKASLPPRKRPDAVDALVAVAAVLHVPAQILTSDPDGLRSYVATLDRADVVVEKV